MGNGISITCTIPDINNQEKGNVHRYYFYMKNTNRLFFVLILVLTTHTVVVNAEDSSLDLEYKLSELKREKTQAEVMISILEKSGRLSAIQAIDAKKEIADSYEDNMESLKQDALEKIQNSRSLSSF